MIPRYARQEMTEIWSPQSKFRIWFEIEADGFLYNMVRNIVGTLVEVGRGRMEPQQVATILAQQDRSCAGPTAPAHGLFLLAVRYPVGLDGRTQ